MAGSRGLFFLSGAVACPLEKFSDDREAFVKAAPILEDLEIGEVIAQAGFLRVNPGQNHISLVTEYRRDRLQRNRFFLCNQREIENIPR